MQEKTKRIIQGDIEAVRAYADCFSVEMPDLDQNGEVVGLPAPYPREVAGVVRSGYRIHEQFIRQITRARGLMEFQTGLTDKVVVPTPGAVLLASELLAKGSYEQEGIGSVILVDIGGATTDIHSALPELENLTIEERGLIINNEKQFSYRTVEGNLGLRVSAMTFTDFQEEAEYDAKLSVKNRKLADEVEKISALPEYAALKQEALDIQARCRTDGIRRCTQLLCVGRK